MNVLVDDRLLREVLLEQEPSWLGRARGAGQLFTTGLWYYRLCSALWSPAVTGSLSGPISRLPAVLRSQVLEQVAGLPGTVQLLSLRDSS